MLASKHKGSFSVMLHRYVAPCGALWECVVASGNAPDYSL